MTETDIYAFLRQCRLGVLGSVWNSSPQSALVGIAVTPQLEIVFDTVSSSRKYRNLTARPECSFVFGWTGEQTVQYEGAANQLASPELERYQKVYFETWPDGPARMHWPGLVYFRVRPTWIRYSDFDQRPPLIEEFNFAN